MSEDRRALRERFAELDTANVADVLDSMGLRAQALEPGFVGLTTERLAGWAFTLRGSATAETGRDETKFLACSQVRGDEVTVWAGGGGDTCFLGELVAVGLVERGCVGALVHGAVRDLHWLRKQAFPVFATNRSPIQSAARWRVDSYQVEVRLPGANGTEVTITPGDFVLADEDGVVIVPQAVVPEVLTAVEALTRHEQALRAELASGLSLDDALDRHGKV